MNYLYPKQILFLHEKVIEISGGSPEIRDQGLLESAVFRPQATFGGQDLYPDLFAKATALGYSIIKNHPFVDGNKRTGFEALRLMLRINGFNLKASDNEKFQFVMNVAEGKNTEHQMLTWVKGHTKPYKKSTE